jgi:hypothetical protein
MVNGVIHSGGEALLHKNDTIFRTSGNQSGTETLRVHHRPVGIATGFLTGLEKRCFFPPWRPVFGAHQTSYAEGI